MSTHAVNFKFNVIGGNVGKMFASIDRLNGKAQRGFTKTTKDVKKTDTAVGKLIRSARRLDRGYNRAFKSLHRGFKKITTKLGALGSAVVGYFATQQIGYFVSDIINQASDLNEAANKSKIVFGEAFTNIERWASRAAQSVGMSKQEALAASSSFGGMFKNMGFGSDQVEKLSKGAVQLAADLASFHNIDDPTQAFNALFSGLKGESEVLASNFNIVIDEAMVKQKAFDMGLTDTVKGVLPKAIKTQATYALVMDQSKDAMGDFARTSDDYATSKKIFLAQLQNLTTWLGGKFFPIATKMMNKFRGMASWVDQNKESVAKWAKWLGILAGVFGGVFVAAKVILGIVGFIDTVKTAFLIMKGVMLNNPFGWAILAVTLIAKLIMSNDKLRNKIVSFFREIPAKAQALFDYLVSWAKYLWKFHPFSWMIELTDRIFPGFKQRLGEVLTGLKDQFLKLVSWFYDNVIEPVVGYWNKFKSMFGFGEKTVINKVTVKNEDPEQAENLYQDVTGVLGSKSGSPSSSGGKGKSVSERLAGISASGQSSIKNINISIDNLVKELIVRTENMKMAESEIKAIISKTLLTAVNDVNYG